jgi:nucleotide-binding universal stress UspA family protein
MSKEKTRLHRILLPFDVSPDSLTALDAALIFAAAFKSHIMGLFVEDTNLLAAVSFPMVREVAALSGATRQIGTAEMEHQLRTLAEKARKALSERAHRMHVASSFRVARGDVTSTILTAASGADLVVVGKAGWSGVILRRTGRTCFAVASACQMPVLVVERGANPLPPMLVVDDGTPAAQRALDLAAEISASLGWQTGVLSAGGASDVDEILARIDTRRPRLIVLPLPMLLKNPSTDLKCPILIVP